MTKFAVGSMLLLVAASGASINSHAATPTAKEEYELQERCGKRAEASFKKEWGSGIQNTADGQMVAVFENHYNRRLNKCLVLYRTTNVPKKRNNADITVTTSFVLFDINANKEYGQLWTTGVTHQVTLCNLLEKPCQSKEEWDALIKPYMND